ncbi:cobalt chelatase [Paraburkholderia sp. CNPSo 3076]|uniref:cobaltochelatase CobT-related protein n=1 Tax=Paraburkholderia sp. CNPSo 3076 TaxID=2940936 RepID=UPI0022575F15|nr:cobalt chelatase [Paraburkholderia sp. CNPSo 3076]MCX5543119.1 cobalt chelatase [Paraburkholderia sp. CNPSo 3076]
MSATPTPEAVRTALRRESLCAAAVRALTGDAALHYRGGRLCRESRPLPLHAPHLRSNVYEDEFASLRGAADAAAQRLLHSDAALHRLLSPDAPIERLLFELFEQVRCEARLPPGMPGLAHNLRHRFETWSRAWCRAGLSEGHLGILLYTVAQIVWSRVSGWPVLDETEDLIEATRAGIVPAIGVQLAGLRATRADQRAYAVHARELARRVATMLDDARAARAGDDAEEARAADDALTSFSLWVDFDETSVELPALAPTGVSRVLAEAANGYRAYTTQYDREIRPAERVREALLREYRERLDERIAACGINVARLARTLQMAIAVPQRDGWLFGEEDGRIDGRRLAQVVSSPAERRVFRRERFEPRSDCVVGFLIDCSGSMKAHIEPVAMMVDLLARACEQAGIATEVLGFTTLAWNGGRARADWLGGGRPPHPGRLNETCHMVFKSADESWRRARPAIAALLKADLFREGVDGEAVEWACARLASRAEARRILVAISDGSPMDTATAQTNDAFYLDNHLKEVVARHEAMRDVDVIGLGVGLDLSPYYRHCVALDSGEALDMARLIGLAQWIGAPR